MTDLLVVLGPRRTGSVAARPMAITTSVASVGKKIERCRRPSDGRLAAQKVREWYATAGVTWCPTAHSATALAVARLRR